jgi:cell division protein FtsB
VPGLNLRQLSFAIYLAVFAALCVLAGLYFVRTNEEYNRLKLAQADNRRQLALLEKHLDEQQQTLQRLRSDPAYVEWIIRRNLGYAKPEDKIFTFPPTH